MYPNLYYAFKDLFGWNLPGLRFVNSFGFFLAMAFLSAATVLAAELRRKSKAGLLHPTMIDVEAGKPASVVDLAINFAIGFVFGYKILGIFLLPAAERVNPQEYIFSGAGNVWGGLLLGAIAAGLKWWDKRKSTLATPVKRSVRLWPHDRVGELTVLALVFGVLGAKLFSIFETWDQFVADPVGSIFSGGGLTFYGGLICATIAITLYARKHGIKLVHLADSIAPALMIAYAVGRIGCQVSGDGDWGISNSAFASTPDGKVVTSTPDAYRKVVETNPQYFSQTDTGSRSSAYFPKPKALGFLPDWMFAYNFPQNVNNVGIPIAGVTEEHYKQLPAPAFPTSFYETVMCTLFFGLLWVVRKKLKPYGSVFALYLIFNGLERFLIEQIRVNNRGNFLGMQITQAEFISACIVLAGIALAIWLRIAKRKTGEGIPSAKLVP